MLLHIEERHLEPDITQLELSGRLELGSETQRVETLIDELADRPTRKVILNLTGLSYIDSAGIGMLALATGKMKGAGGNLVVVTGKGKVLDMLAQTQLNRVVSVAGTVAEAAAALGGRSTGA